jgi:hypothetical protein
MEREHEGYYNSVKSLLNLPDAKERGICGAVGQLLKVVETYETAIEAALGGALQNSVTETEEDARDAIGYLKRRNLGRATFLPVTAIKGRPLEGRQAILAEVGVIGTAYELVSFEEKFRQLAMYLLGRILVVENLDKAVQLAKKGVLQECDVEILGTSFESIERAEDRELFKELCQGLGEPVLPSEIAETLEDGLRAAAEIGYPVVLRPAFTLGGTGGGFADDEEECRVMLKNALAL